MTDVQQRNAAKQFARDWKDKGYEKGESQPFWIALLRNVYGVEQPEHFITFEEQVHLDHTSFIDGNIQTTHVLIEQKGLGKDLKKPIRQSDGTFLTPFQQAKRYAAELPYSMRPHWIVTSNFQEFHVYDMECPSGEPEIILLENLGTEYYRLQFLVDTGDSNIRKEMEISLQAGELVGVLYNALLKQYKDPTNPETLKSLNILCVRLVFCLYAENIHKVIDPLFLNGLKEEFERIQEITVERTRDKKLREFQTKLSKLTFLENKTPSLLRNQAA